jgi:hypothetical protein
MIKDPQSDSFLCPFCCSEEISAIPGKVVCQRCGTSFEIDDCGECVFVDPLIPKLPMRGTFCPVCGLIQDEETESCFFARGHYINGCNRISGLRGSEKLES